MAVVRTMSEARRLAPDISGIDSTGQGYINYYDSDNNLLTRVPSAPAPEENDSEGDDAEPALSASMKQAVSQLEVRGALRQNLMQDTSIVQQDYDADAHVLTIRAELSIATLTGTLGSLKALQAQGVTTIALVTSTARPPSTLQNSLHLAVRTPCSLSSIRQAFRLCPLARVAQ